jgi:hypothetical protein
MNGCPRKRGGNIGPGGVPRVTAASGYYSVPYSSTLYYHYENWGSAYTYEASYSDWARDGFPAPQPVTTDFVHYPWSSAIYAVSYFDGGWVWKQLAFEQWQRAGAPRPRNAGYIEGTTYHKWSTSSEILAKAPDGNVHKLSYGEWQASGFQEPEYRNNRGYQQLSWGSDIAYMFNITSNYGYRVDYAEWQAEGFPTPQKVRSFPGDEFCQYWFSSDIYYWSDVVSSHKLSYGEWQAAGFPRPTQC